MFEKKNMEDGETKRKPRFLVKILTSNWLSGLKIIDFKSCTASFKYWYFLHRTFFKTV